MIPQAAAKTIEAFLKTHNLIPPDPESKENKDVEIELRVGMDIPLTATKRSQLSAELLGKHRITFNTLEASSIFVPSSEGGTGLNDVVGHIKADALIMSMMSGSKDASAWAAQRR